MQAAEVLGIPAEDVRPTVVDTDSVGYTAVTGGSRTTFATGWAAYEAAQDVLRQMKERAAKIRQAEAASIVMDRATFRETAARLQETGGPVVGRGAVNPRGVGGSFSGAIADVEVDSETGKVTILRFTSVQDAGKAIHPSYVEGQMQGGSAQGIGWALNEEYYMSPSGTMMNSSLLDYRMPTALDLPMIDTVIVEVPNPGHPFGARGVGEANIVPPPAAIANAIYRAVGVRMTSLPMNPPRIMEEIWRQRD
jgi:CO/xanthine dehydrogenase Mo-binding subunit